MSKSRLEKTLSDQGYFIHSGLVTLNYDTLSDMASGRLKPFMREHIIHLSSSFVKTELGQAH
jgi:hypothetical protein